MSGISALSVDEDTSHVNVSDFFRHLHHSNPFEANRISDPDDVAADVKSINGQPFRELLQLAKRANLSGRGIGAVLWGEAGVGKSHLLARLCRHLGEDGCFVFLHNLQASPQRLPRYVLRCVIGRLTDTRNGDLSDSRLYRAVDQAVAIAVGSSQHGSIGKSHKEFCQLMDHLAQDNPCALGSYYPAICDVLFRFFDSVKSDRNHDARIAVRWLSGDILDGEEVDALGLERYLGEDSSQLVDDQAVESVLIAVAELASLSDQTFVILLDQVDNLCDAQVSSLARFAHVLIDHLPNLLIVTSGVQSRLIELKDNFIINESCWDRIAQEEVDLRRIRRDEARELLKTRLEADLKKYVEALPEVQQAISDDRLFPLGSKWFEQRLRDGLEFRPRDVINWAKARWRHQVLRHEKLTPDQWFREWTDDSASTDTADTSLRASGDMREDDLDRDQLIDEKVDAKLKEQQHRRELDRGALPGDALNLCGLVEQLLRQCVDVDNDYSIVSLENGESKTKKQPTYDLLVDEDCPGGNRRTTGVKFLATGSKQSMTAAIKRLAGDRRPPDHVLLVTEERHPLKPGPAGMKRLEELNRRGSDAFLCHELSFADYARLDALQAVVGDARSGDLELDMPDGHSTPIAEQEVIQSHHRQDRYRQTALLRKLLTEETVGCSPPAGTRLADEDELKQFIAAQLALTMGASSVELAVKFASLKKLNPNQQHATKEAIEDVALLLHRQCLINATPQDDHLYLLYRPAESVAV